jgi:perosamine synthetase
MPPVPVNTPLLADRVRDYLLECYETGWISSEGPFVHRLEAELARSVGRPHGVAASSGTAALELAVRALDLGPGDEVILPTFTIISCAAAVVRAGATPVLVDSDPVTWNMDLQQVEAKITSATRAIMAVHVYGLPVDMDRVLALAREHGLLVIEDAAEMLGQTVRGRPCGQFGAVSVFSLYPNKLVTAGEGGVLVTSSDRLAARLRSLRNLCFEPGRRFVHHELGWNYRMSNVQAAVAVAQLEQLPSFVERKRRMGALYTRLLAGCPGLALPPPRADHAESIYWVYGVLATEDASLSAEQIQRRLEQQGIGTRPFFWPMHEQPVFRKMGLFAGEQHPVAERLARRGFYLPSGLGLTEEQIHHVAARLREVMSS